MARLGLLLVLLVSLTTLEYALGQLTCNQDIYSRKPCRASSKVGCLVANCCFDDANNQCYRKEAILSMGFRPTKGPSQTGSNLLHLGGEPGYTGNMLIRTCVPRFARCGRIYPPMTVERCLQHSCCWNNLTSTCFQASHYIIRQRTNCPPGFTNPPQCKDIDECASNPCMNGGVCSNHNNRYTCTCPAGITGTNCENVCSAPPTVSFGSYAPTGTTFNAGATVVYSCSAGYTISGATTLTCQVTKVWTPAAPTCIKACSGPPTGPGLSYAPPGTTFNIGQSVTYSCLTQPALVGPTTNNCLAGGVWSSTSAPTCDGCGPPPALTNGIYTQNKPSYSLNEMVQYTCATGYTLIGSSSNQCMAGNTWSQTTAPTCSSAVCPTVPTVAFGSFTPTTASVPNVAIGGSATYTCNQGYSLKGSATINCGAGPAWVYPSGPTSCTRDCAAPPIIGSNGNQPAASVPYIEGETVQYSCSGAFSISGSATLTCTSGSWVPAAAPTCVADCPPNPISVGTGTTSVTGTSFPVGTTLLYTSCLTPPGAQLVGTTTNECLTGASWKNPPPECKLECPRPTPPANGAITPTTASIPSGQSYTFSCDAGYTFNPLGQMAVPCTITGSTVTFNVPATNICLKNCPAAPAAGANSVATTYSTAVIGTTYSPDTVATYACAANFDFPSGTSDKLVCQSTGVWSPTSAPVCQAACGTPPLTTNLAAAPVATKYGLGASITYSCANNEKVIPQSSITSTCGANGVWSVATAPTCQAVCINPPPFAAGTGTLTPIQATYTASQTVTYTCTAGSNLVGTSTTTCTAGTLAWVPPTGPQCVPDCSTFPPANANSNIATTPTAPFTTGNTVVYSCNTGFTPLGSLTLTCQNTGVWSPTTAPTCRKVCSAPPGLSSGTGQFAPVKTEYEVNEEVTYSCTGVLNVRGVNKNKCKADGTWEYTTGPSCEAVCYAAPTITNGDYTPKNTYTNALGSVTYTCNAGSVPTTPQTVTCQSATLTWSPTPSCRKSCAAPPAVTNAGTGSASTWAEGDVITYACAPTTSYKIVAATSGNNAPHQNECLTTGLWKYTTPADLPTCVAICSTAPPTTTGTATIAPAAGPYDLNTNAVYTCTSPSPSNPVGDTTLKCTGPNTWTPATAPTCVSACINVPQIAANGNQIAGTQWTGGQTVTYSCTSAAYALTTPTINTCTASTLTWTSATAPSCLQKCTTALPSAPSNGNNVLDTTKNPVPGENVEGTRYTYTCAATYALAIGSSTENTCTGGAWPNAAPSCVPACTNPPAGTVGSPTPSPNNALNPQGTSVTYTCGSGTTLVGTATIACQATRAWLPATAPECITDCTAPPSIPSNGAANTPAAGPYTIGLSITYACAANFRLVGSTTNTCQRVGTATAGTWSATAPTCAPSDKDLDIVMILDGNDPLDGCSSKTPAVTPPILPGGSLTGSAFPNFFLQQSLAAAIESGWGTVAQAHTRIGYHMHAGVCTSATNQNQLPIKQLSSTASTLTLFTSLAYPCATPNNPIKAIQCAETYHFIANHGDRPTISNVVILVMHNTQSYTAAERATFLSEITAIRASLKGTLMIVSILPSVDSNYAANEAYIRLLLGCPATGVCLNFLGSAATSSTVLSKLRLAAATLP